MRKIDGLFKIFAQESGSAIRQAIKPKSIEGLEYKTLMADVVQLTSPKPKMTFGAKKIMQGVRPEITSYNTGINDGRLSTLLVEKRVNCDVGSAKYPQNYTFVDEFGQTRLKPHLYIDGIEVRPEFARQGICYNVEKQIVELSKKEGFEGRVVLLADSMPKSETRIVRSSLAHWKSGFRFCDEKSNKTMELVLEGKLPLCEAPLGYMYFPV